MLVVKNGSVLLTSDKSKLPDWAQADLEVKVNPYDTEGIFKALNQISSWNYNKIRYGFDLVSINKNSTENWIKGFLLDMKRVMLNDSDNKDKIGLGRNISIMKYNEHFRQIKPDKLLNYFQNSQSRLLIFNYENTLQSIDESENIENKNFINKMKLKIILNILSMLCEDPKNMVFIISKFDHNFLYKIFGKIKNLGICGENGFFYKYPYSE